MAVANPPLKTLRGTSSLSPTADSTFAQKYYGLQGSDIVGVFPATDTWAHIAGMPVWVDDMNVVAGNPMLLDYPMLPDGIGSLALGASGSYDSYAQTFAQNLASNPRLNANKIFIRIGREFNGNWYRWTASGVAQNALDYNSYFRRIVGIFRQYAPGVRIIWCPVMGIGSMSDVSAAYPGDDVVDIMGQDVYDFWWQHPTATAAQRWTFNYTTQAYGIGWFINFAATHNKPICWPEVGLCGANDTMAGGSGGGGGGDDVYFINQMYQLSHDYNALCIMWFSTDAEAGNHHDMNDYPAASARFIQLYNTGATQPNTAAGDAAGSSTSATAKVNALIPLVQAYLALMQAYLTTLTSQINSTQAQLVPLQAQQTQMQNTINQINAALAMP